MAWPEPDPVPAPVAGVRLPLDAVYEIMLRLPVKELCRLRIVCRLWRSLLSNPLFAATHAACHPGPPLIAAHHTSDMENGTFFDIMDLSGRVLKRVHMTVGRTEQHERVISTQLDIVRFWRGASIRLLNPATGAVYALPSGLAEEHEAYGLDITHYSAMVASALVATTGEYKVLRLLDSYPNSHPGQLYEVCNLDGGSHARWRGKRAPSYNVEFGDWSSVVIDGIVYFLSDEFVHSEDAGPDRIASFDLETEEWKPSLRGPISSLLNGDDDDYTHDVYFDWYDYSLASLSGRLVLVHSTPTPSVDLWFLMDIEKGLWFRQHIIETGAAVHPLLVLNDGRIVLIRIGSRGCLRVYNPRTNTFTDMAEIGHYHAVGLYTGSLLSLANGTRE